MKIRITVFAVAAVLAVAAGGVVVPAPAGAGAVTARTLPAGDTMFAIECNGTPGQLNSVDPATAAFTPIGSSQDIDGSGCGYGMAYNPVTGKSYVLAGGNNSNEWPIVEVDLTTGVEIEISRIEIDGSPTLGYPAVMTFDALGNAYAIVDNDFYALDISTGNATLRGSVGNFVDIYALALNPADGGCYAVSEDGELISIDRNTGAGTLIVHLPLEGGVYSLQFDSSGFGWLNTGGGSRHAISSFDLADPQGSLVDSSADATEYSGAYLIVPPAPPTPPSSATTSTTAAPSGPVSPAFTG